MNSAILEENQGHRTRKDFKMHKTASLLRQAYFVRRESKKTAKNAQLKENMLAYFPP